jgi:phosphoribosyl 1,2-cyclic phosphate phosphodiesterase
MELTFLGTGGSQPIPLPFCDCDRCRRARSEGPPYTRQGCELYLPEIAGMIDASEFAPANLSRWGVPELEYLFLSHWHPDHVAGVRLLSMRPAPYSPTESHVEQKRRTAPTVVTTRPVYEEICDVTGTLEHFIEEMGFADVHFLDESPLRTGGWTVEAIAYPLRADGPIDATGFVFDDGDSSLAVVTDDAAQLDESRLPDDLDGAVFECGHFTHDPAGERIRGGGPEDDLSHEAVLERVHRLDPDRAFLSHISHHYQRGYDEFRAMEHAYDGVRFAYDELTATV